MSCDVRTGKTFQATTESSATNAWEFAQAVLGRGDRPTRHEYLTWLAQVSSVHEARLRSARWAEELAAQQREYRQWLADVTSLREADWDPAKHPRAGTAPNRGWFAATGSTGTAGSAPLAQRSDRHGALPTAGESDRVLARIRLSSGTHWSGDRVLDALSALAPEWSGFVKQHVTLSLTSDGAKGPTTTLRAGEFGPEISDLTDAAGGRVTVHFEVPKDWNDFQVVQHMLGQFAENVAVHRLATRWAAGNPQLFARIRQERFAHGLDTIATLAGGYYSALASLAPGGQAAVAAWDIQRGEHLGAALSAAFALPIGKLVKAGVETTGTIAIQAGEKLIAALPVRLVERVGKLSAQKQALLHQRLLAAHSEREAATIVEEFLATPFDRHHPLAKFLGGEPKQFLAEIPRPIHQEFHALLREELRAAGFTLRIGGPGGEAARWAAHFSKNNGSQGRAFDAVLRASRAIDAKHGTTVTQWVWQNLIGKRFFHVPVE